MEKPDQDILNYANFSLRDGGMGMYYKLNEDNEPVEVTNITDEDFKNRWRRKDELPDGKIVSSIFLVIDHGFDGKSPILFETMVFPNKDDYTEIDAKRYCTYAEANVGHDEFVAKYS